ncbi:hypothetical protein AVEN_158725-1 [Araneus ventricosus]|uniref:Uncharacterized protein n=1 Tax=Araneus ventricosus TaxID=182803 RepID=A0A4Y2TTG0_ARAVE|nr:hypothetical protein AVEN_86100-1 [Araneus ventricosus]GBO03924.1 hypothetical protein AVEN_158725-1 [Araneus ventricosus]
MESSLSLQKFQEDDTQDWAINCQQRKELLFFSKIHSVARNCPSTVSIEWGGLRRVRAHRVGQAQRTECPCSTLCLESLSSGQLNRHERNTSNEGL